MRWLLLIVTALLCCVAPSASAKEVVHHPPAEAEPNQVSGGAEIEAHKKTDAATGGEHGGSHHEPRTYFGIPASILKFINMIAFFGVLFFILRGPVGKAFAERNASIRAELAEATVRREKSNRLAEEIAERLQKIEGDVAAVLERAREEGERQKQEIIAAAQLESQKILDSARGEVEARVKSARKELTEYAGELASRRAEQLLKESVTEADQKKIFGQRVRQLAELES